MAGMEKVLGSEMKLPENGQESYAIEYAAPEHATLSLEVVRR
jgi:hypothetical protein